MRLRGKLSETTSTTGFRGTTYQAKEQCRRDPDFLRLWIGETVSQVGSMISQLALPLVAILMLHASTFEVGLVAALGTSAFLVVGPRRGLGSSGCGSGRC
jgi:hypothetical protein